MSTTSRTKIPVINLQDYMHGSPEAQQRFVKTWGDGLREFGFVAVEGHPIDRALIRRAYDLFAQYFALPSENKSRYGGVAGGARGYTGFGKEHAKDQKVGDLKEFWHIGRELAAGHPYRAEYADNVWPSEMPELKDVTLTLFAQLDHTAEVLLRALGDYFQLDDRETFVKAVKDGNSVMRAIHYPPLRPEMDPRAVRAAAHEDINMITILCEATDGGLEILTHEGEWIEIDALEGQLVVDSGDMLSRFTNDVIPATTHRVVNPKGENRERYSLPFFVHPYSGFNLECLPCCNTAENPAKYPPITAGEFLTQRLREIGLLK
ncbi:MAG TPA: 2-oxoglutarate and iron-dependent oxygenase domain-containing protein [Oscillatoriaceae cyanobacterium]